MSTKFAISRKRLYARADWQWAQNGGLTVTHGWKPETGFIKYRWTGYSEALILYILGLGLTDFSLARKELSSVDQNITSGKSFMATNLFMPDRSSSITCRTCG